MAANLTILRTYALRSPESFPKSILYSHTESALAIFDAYPKSIFHFLVLPRVREPLAVEDLADLRTLMRKDAAIAKGVIQGLATVAESLKQDIEEEMINRYGFKWDVWTGFHGAPSMTCVLLLLILVRTFELTWNLDICICMCYPLICVPKR